MPTVLITDSTFETLDVERSILEPLGCSLDHRQCKTPAELLQIDSLSRADAVVTQFARVDRSVIDRMTHAKVIVRYGIGVDNVDLEAARDRGIPVCNVPDYCVQEVADHTLAFILAATRQVPRHCDHLRAGVWGLAVPLDGLKTLCDLTVGVVGCGRIGREVINRLLAFHTRVLVHDPAVSVDEIRKLGAQPASSLEELLAGADLITLHCPSTPRTRRMIDSTALGRMKPGAILVNLSRGDLVDTEALVKSLQDGGLSVAALDVCDPEPIPAGHPLLKMPNVIVAPHIASASVNAVQRLRTSVAETVAKSIRGERLPNVVNGVDLIHGSG